MDHQSVYQKLIEKAQSRQKPDCYTERHHILPKSLGGDDESDNLVNLTAREHFIAHLLLAKIYGGPMITAAFMMSNFKRYHARKYSWVQEEYSKMKSENWKGSNNPSCIMDRSGENAPMYGKHHCEETKQKLREKNLGFKRPDDVKQRISESHKGKIKSVEHRRNLSKSLTGKKKSEEHCRKISEIQKGRQLSEEHKKKTSETMKGIPKPKNVCRISDRKEMSLALFIRYDC